MKWLVLLVFCFFEHSSAEVAKKSNSKTYSEEEFVKKVSEEVQKKISDIKNKSIQELTRELVDKEELLRLREIELVKREDQIKIHSLTLETKVKEFNSDQQKILGCANKNEEEIKSRITQQVDVISNMQPAKAAQLLSVQDPEIAVRIIQQLDTKKASKIFNIMDKEVSARLQKQYLDMKR